MGRRVRWGEIETNNMCKVIFRLWQQTHPGKNTGGMESAGDEMAGDRAGEANSTNEADEHNTNTRNGTHTAANAAAKPEIGHVVERTRQPRSRVVHTHEVAHTIDDEVDEVMGDNMGKTENNVNSEDSTDEDRGFTVQSPIMLLGSSMDEEAGSATGSDEEAREKQARKAKRAKAVNDQFRQGLELLDEFCPWCWVGGHGITGYARRNDLNNQGRIDIEMDAAYMQAYFRKHQPDGGAGCRYCGFPCEVCNRWARREDGEWQGTGTACQRLGVLFRLWAAMQRRERERCEEMMRREGYGKGADGETIEEERYWRWMSEGTSWRGWQTS
jgi:hypothetical protein